MNNKIEKFTNNIFEDIKHIDEFGNEYWLARELQNVLGYHQWRSINDLIERAKVACNESKYSVEDHFAVQRKMIKLAKSAARYIIDYKLSRYACYLIVMNGNPKKEIIALGQTYFAIQTRKMELTEHEFNLLSEDEKRLYRRKQTRDGNKSLFRIASVKGVKNFDRFTNAGYRGLYNGETADDIAKRKKLRYREEILDNMSSTELGANVFRITQTESLLEMQKEPNENIATETHYRVGRAIRNVIKELGGIMPEDLPKLDKSIKELESSEEYKKIEKDLSKYY